MTKISNIILNLSLALIIISGLTLMVINQDSENVFTYVSLCIVGLIVGWLGVLIAIAGKDLYKRLIAIVSIIYVFINTKVLKRYKLKSKVTYKSVYNYVLSNYDNLRG